MKPFVCILTILLFIGCERPGFSSKWINEKAPEEFVTKFETSKGTFNIKVTRSFSPKAVDRFYQLVKHHFFNNSVFYRVVPNFVAQFGSSDSVKNLKWQNSKVADEKVLYSNKKGTLSFARSGVDSRATDLYINLKDNFFLDSLNYSGVKEFPAFGDVISGMEVVDSLYSGYGDNVFNKLDTFYIDRKKFFNIYPGLDVIKKAFIVKEK